MSADHTKRGNAVTLTLSAPPNAVMIGGNIQKPVNAPTLPVLYGVKSGSLLAGREHISHTDSSC